MVPRFSPTQFDLYPTYFPTERSHCCCAGRPLRRQRQRRRLFFRSNPAAGWFILVFLAFLGTGPCAFGEGVPDSERAALIALYQSTAGDNWYFRDNWLGPVGTESDWYGVTVENGHVVSISMINGGMVGEIPSQLADLPYLSVLELRYAPPPPIGLPGMPLNHLTLSPDIGSLVSLQVLSIPYGDLSSLPASLGELSNLLSLDVHHNHLSELPDMLGGLSSLEALDLESNDFESLGESIGQLPALRTLNLSHNPLPTLPPEIGRLETLEVLDLQSCRLVSLTASIGDLHELVELDLHYNELETLPPEIGELRNLVELDLERNVLTHLPDEIGNLKNITHLALSHNSLTSLPSGIGGMRGLQTIDVSYNELASLPGEIGDLDQALSLNASHNRLATVPAGIGGMAALQALNLGDNLVAALPEEVGNLRNAQSIGLRHNLLQLLPHSIGSLESLEALDLPYNELGALPPEIGNLGSLRTLNLTSNLLTDLPAEFAMLRSLQTLYLDWNELTAFPSALSQLTNLTELVIANNHLEGPFPSDLIGLTNLVRFDLTANRLVGGLPESLRDMTTLEHLDLDYNGLYATSVGMIGYLRQRLTGGYEHWASTQTRLPTDLELHALNADTVEIEWGEIPGRSSAIVLFYSSVTSDKAGLIDSGIEAPRSNGKITLTGLRLGREYHFAVQSISRPGPSNQNRVETELSYVFDYSVPAVLPVYFPLVISNSLQFTGVSVTNLSPDPAVLQFTAMGLNGEALLLPRNPADLLLPPSTQRAALMRELFQGIPSGAYWVRMTTDNPEIASLCLIGNYRLSELDGYLPMVLPSRQFDFPRVYEGFGVFHGQKGQTRLALVNPTPEAVSLRVTLHGPGPNQQFEEPDTQLTEPATFTLPPDGLLTGTVSELFQQSLEITSGDATVEILQGDSLVGASLVEFRGTLMAVTGDRPLPGGIGYAPSIIAGSSGTLDVFTNLKLINRGDSWNTGGLTATDPAGDPLGHAGSVGLWPQRSWEETSPLFWISTRPVIGSKRPP